MKKMRKVVSTLLLVCMLATILTVSAYAADPGTVTGITFTPGSGNNGGKTDLKTGEVISITADYTINASGTDDRADYYIGWYVDDVMVSPMGTHTPSMAFSKTVTGNYRVYAAAIKGNTPVYKTAAVNYVVSEPAPEPQYVVFTNVPSNYLSLDYYGDWGPVQYQVLPTGSSQDVTFDSSNAGVAFVDSSTGIVHAVGSGTAVITAKIKGTPAGNFTVEVTVPVASITLTPAYLNLEPNGQTGVIKYTVMVGDKATNKDLTWTSSDGNVASVKDNGDGTATVTSYNPGQAKITASTTDGTAISEACIVTVSPTIATPKPKPDVPAVVVTPVNVSLVLGESKTLTATILNPDAKTGTKIDHWYCTSPAVTIAPNPYDLNSCTIKGVALSTSPVEVRAFAADGSYGYAMITVSQADALELGSNVNTVKHNGQVTVSVLNPRPGESFNWSYTPMDTNVIAGTMVKDNSLVLTGGAMDGLVTVTATSKLDASRTASLSIGVNGVDPYGNASIIPKSVNWKYGDGDLVFQVKPACYWAYLDNQYLNTKSTSLASYWNGALTLKQSYLATLSNGTHTLKVYTAYDEYNNPTGLVYANIYITSNGPVNNGGGVGGNSHVKGTASNLYFNSATAIKDVYISNKWIDPANYTLSPDGKALTLNANFLNQLAYGTYTMTLNSNNGTTQSTNFRIVTANYAPSTGDESNIGLWMAIMILSGVGALALIPRRKKLLHK